MQVELVVFDMAGTTVYDGDAVHTCLEQALSAAKVIATRDQINAVMGLPKPIAIRLILEELRSPEVITHEFVGAIHADFERRMLDYYRTDPAVREIRGASETFKALKQAGTKVALDTGFNRAIVDTILERLGWIRGDLVDTTVASDEVAHGRPHSDMILRAMELTGVTDPGKVAKVGDTPSDLHEGQAAGCGWIIGVTRGSHTAAELEPHPHTHLIASVAELPCLLIGS